MSAQPSLPLVPVPGHAERRAGEPFSLAGARVVAPGGAGAPADHLIDRAAVVAGVRLVRSAATGPGAVVLRLDPHARHAVGTPGAGEPGGYVLDVTADTVTLTAPDVGGLHHGVATVLQLTDQDTATVPPVRVEDSPRFAWRGLAIDVVRHFHAVPTVLALLDVMADLRLNVLHLHLTDDQGWRLDLASYPELTARSGHTAVDGDPGGWYSAQDYAAIQAYAARRGIVVVPEIDLPGHVNAALHAVPELNPDGVARPVYEGIEVGFSRLHADLPATAPFVRSVLAEVAALTTGPYVHIGGDEPPAMPPDEYAELVGLATEAVRGEGKTVVCWQEGARAPLPAGSLVQYWDERADADVVTAAAAAGARVLLSPASRAYLDMKYDATTPVGLDWAGHIDLRHAYDWEPLAVLPDVEPGAVAGVEAAVWAETIRTPEDLFFLLLPRLAAFAEVAWSAPTMRDWSDFAARVAALGPRWDAAGLSWGRVAGVDWTPGPLTMI